MQPSLRTTTMTSTIRIDKRREGQSLQSAVPSQRQAWAGVLFLHGVSGLGCLCSFYLFLFLERARFRMHWVSVSVQRCAFD